MEYIDIRSTLKTGFVREKVEAKEWRWEMVGNCVYSPDEDGTNQSRKPSSPMCAWLSKLTPGFSVTNLQQWEWRLYCSTLTDADCY